MSEEKNEMSDKTKDVVAKVSWGLVAAGIVGLLVVGITSEEVSAGTALIETAYMAVSTVIAFIFGRKK